MPKILLPLIMALLAAGCATTSVPQAMLTFETQPVGATLYEGGVAIGQEPVTRTYRGEPGAKTIRSPDVTAVWPSGAKAVFWTVLRPGADEVALIERPAQAAGLDKDQAHAAQVTAVRLQAASREAQQIKKDAARNSARCQQQMQSGVGSPIDNCQ